MLVKHKICTNILQTLKDSLKGKNAMSNKMRYNMSTISGKIPIKLEKNKHKTMK